MPVFTKDDIRILYVHIPKTGGTSVETFFRKNGYYVSYHDGGNKPGNLNVVRRCSPQHLHKQILEELFEVEKFDYSFSIVRDPLTRVCSEYLMRQEDFGSYRPCFQTWITNTLKRYIVDPYIYDNHLRPQNEFFFPGSDFYKLEDGLDDNWVLKLEKVIGVQFKNKLVDNIMQRKKLNGITSSEVYLSEEAKKTVYRFYQKDFQLFNY